jgi:hypothetical protein
MLDGSLLNLRLATSTFFVFSPVVLGRESIDRLRLAVREFPPAAELEASAALAGTVLEEEAASELGGG